MFAECVGGCTQSPVFNKNSASVPAFQALSPHSGKGSLGRCESEAGEGVPAWLLTGLLHVKLLTTVGPIFKVSLPSSCAFCLPISGSFLESIKKNQNNNNKKKRLQQDTQTE